VSRALILDSEALATLGGRASRRQEEVRAAMRAAALLQRDVIVPAVVLAELYRGAGRNQAVDACLARETGIRVRDTDRPLARLVGVVLTGDPDDLASLAAPYPNITVQPLP
jgi:predicted nucleic acid-binding protein